MYTDNVGESARTDREEDPLAQKRRVRKMREALQREIDVDNLLTEINRESPAVVRNQENAFISHVNAREAQDPTIKVLERAETELRRLGLDKTHPEYKEASTSLIATFRKDADRKSESSRGTKRKRGGRRIGTGKVVRSRQMRRSRRTKRTRSRKTRRAIRRNQRKYRRT